MPGNNYHHGTAGERNLLEPRQRFQAVHPRPPDVQQHHIVSGARQLFTALLAGCHGECLITLIPQDPGKRLPDQWLIVHDQDARRLHERPSPAETSAALISRSADTKVGRSTMNRAPAGVLFSTRMVASCSARVR